MPHDTGHWTSQHYDLLIIGGGIHGLFAAYDAATRGLSVALVERGDFGGGLSFNHQRTIHGGLRSLQTGRLTKARAQIDERRTWARLAPSLIRPLPFVVGTYRFSPRSRVALRVGLAVYDRLGRSRNEGIPVACQLPASRVLSRAEVSTVFPAIPRHGLTGGAVWHDYQTVHPDRLNWLVALAAKEAGASLANYTEARAGVFDDGTLTGVEVHDIPSGASCQVRASAILIAAGAGANMVRAALRIRQRVPLVRAVNLLLDAAALDVALAAPGRSGRMLTAVPWRGRTLIGTFQTTDAVYDGLSRPSWSDMDAMLEDAQTAFPGLSCERSRVRHIHHGLTPATVTSHGASLMPDALVTTHADEGLANVISLVGVKFTTARLAAEEAVDLVAKGLDKHVARGSTGARPLPHGASANVDVDISALLKQLDVAIAPDVRAHLAEWYGTEAAAVVRFCAAERLTASLAPGQAILEGEVAYAVRHCDAHRLADVVFRRTPLGSAGHPGRAAIHAAALVMARLLDWNDETTAGQIAEVESVYPDDATAR